MPPPTLIFALTLVIVSLVLVATILLRIIRLTLATLAAALITNVGSCSSTSRSKLQKRFDESANVDESLGEQVVGRYGWIELAIGVDVSSDNAPKNGARLAVTPLGL